MLVDFSSTGTKINNEKMKKNKPYILGENVVFSLADNAHSFKIIKNNH